MKTKYTKLPKHKQAAADLLRWLIQPDTNGIVKTGKIWCAHADSKKISFNERAVQRLMSAKAVEECNTSPGVYRLKISQVEVVDYDKKEKLTKPVHFSEAIKFRPSPGTYPCIDYVDHQEAFPHNPTLYQWTGKEWTPEVKFIQLKWRTEETGFEGEGMPQPFNPASEKLLRAYEYHHPKPTAWLQIQS